MRDACDRRGSNGRTRSSAVSDAVHSARSHGRANRDGNCRPSARDAVLPRTAEADPLGLDAKALHCVDDFLIEARAAIKNQVARGRVIGKSFAKLLDNPGAVRMLRHMAVE